MCTLTTWWCFWKVRWHCNHSKVYFLESLSCKSAGNIKSTDFSHQMNLPLKCLFLWHSPSTAGLFSDFIFLFHLSAAYLSFQIHYLSLPFPLLLFYSCCVPIFNDLFYTLFHNVYICRMNWFYNPPQNESYNLFSSQSQCSVLMNSLLLVVMHTLTPMPGDSSAGLGCVRVRTAWCLRGGDQAGGGT